VGGTAERLVAAAPTVTPVVAREGVLEVAVEEEIRDSATGIVVARLRIVEGANRLIWDERDLYAASLAAVSS
jgi:hypothetical protein